MYTNVLGKGREVTFPADTPIQVRLAPWPVSAVKALARRRAAAARSACSAQQPPFRAETRLVVLHATVRNARGELVTTLERDAFTVYENGKRQPITLFRRDDIPVSLGLLIDNSGSMRTLRSKVEAAALALARASNPQDEIFVLNFNDKAHIDVPFTSDVACSEAGIGRVDAIGGTAMRDAIDMAQTYLSEHGTRDRKVLLVITDGIDNASVATRDRIEQQAEAARHRDLRRRAVRRRGAREAGPTRAGSARGADRRHGLLSGRHRRDWSPSRSRSRGRSGTSTRSRTRR